MITAVRLLPRNEKKSYLMLTYLSANGRKKYLAGNDNNPSSFRIIKDRREIAELEEFPQFEILEFDSVEQLHEYAQQEMEERSRKGLPAVRAAILGDDSVPKIIPNKITPRKAVSTRLPPAANGRPSDPHQNYTGRKPVAPVKVDEPAAMVEHAEDIEPKEPRELTPVPAAPPIDMDMNKRTLMFEAKKRQLKIQPRMTKKELIKAINDFDDSGTGSSMRPGEKE